MITTLSRALVKFAADRWPPHLRDGVRREWLAELAVLTESNERLKSLRFAASLAAHPGHRPEGTATPFLPRLWYAYRVVMIGPVLCVLLLMISFFAASLLTGVMGTWFMPALLMDFAMQAQLPVLTVLSLGSAYLAARIGQRWSPDAPGFLLPVLIGTVPGFLGAAAFLTAGGMDQKLRHLTVFELYFLGFGVVLYMAARLARSGRRKQAWWLGAIGAFVMLDIAVMPAILAIEVSPQEGAIAPAYAPLWLPALLTDTGFGLPHPSPAEVFTITDVLIGVPHVLMILTGWALGMVLGVQNRASSSSSALATAPESPPSTLM